MKQCYGPDKFLTSRNTVSLGASLLIGFQAVGRAIVRNGPAHEPIDHQLTFSARPFERQVYHEPLFSRDY